MIGVEGDASANAAKGPTDPAENATSGNSQNKTAASSSESRQSPVTPLAPLEFLQNQRRGSITDPSLHAAGPNTLNHPSSAGSKNLPLSLRNPEGQTQAGIPHPHPSQGYRFGEASARPNENTLPHIRQLLRSPSAEVDSPSPRAQEHNESDRSPPNRSGAIGSSVPGESNGAKGSERMDIDTQPVQYQTPQDLSPRERPNTTTELGELKGRRASLAGTKRKVSSDREMSTSGNGEADSQLVGPGVPSPLHDGSEGPAPKRRGSAFDTSRIAQLSLYDRRNSVDARAGGGSQWWANERRDSTSSAFSNTPLTDYSTPSSGFPGDSPHGRPPSSIATFAWPANTQTDQGQPSATQPPAQNEANMSTSAAPHYDPLSMMPPVSYPPDRRMSAPAISPESMSQPPSSGPTRVLRSRSRPPSRVRTRDQTTTNNGTQGATAPVNTIPEDASTSTSQVQGAPPPPGLNQKEPGSTPYSRSPELRVSHKLAERKRRKEMKDLFDELRDQLPADRGMKASKWEILSKAIDFITNLKQMNSDLGKEIEMLRHELDGIRQGIPPSAFGPGAPPGPPHPGMLYAPPGVGYPPPGPPGPPHNHHVPPPQGTPTQPQLPPTQPAQSRPTSSQNMYPPPSAPGTIPAPPPTQNGTTTGPLAHPDAPS